MQSLGTGSSAEMGHIHSQSFTTNTPRIEDEKVMWTGEGWKRVEWLRVAKKKFYTLSQVAPKLHQKELILQALKTDVRKIIKPVQGADIQICNLGWEDFRDLV